MQQQLTEPKVIPMSIAPKTRSTQSQKYTQVTPELIDRLDNSPCIYREITNDAEPLSDLEKTDIIQFGSAGLSQIEEKEHGICLGIKSVVVQKHGIYVSMTHDSILYAADLRHMTLMAVNPRANEVFLKRP